MTDKKVIIYGKEVIEATTWGKINQDMKKTISELCINQRATNAITVRDFGITSSMCNKHLFPNYGCRTKKDYKKKEIKPYVNRYYINKPIQRIEKPYSYYPRKRFSKRTHKLKKRG